MARPDTLIDSRFLRDGEEVRVSVRDYRGNPYVALQKWYGAVDSEPSGFQPGKGLVVRTSMIPFLRAAIVKAEQYALEHSLLDEESYESIGEPVPAQLLGEAA